jgi:hypothetical protein
MGNNQSQQSIKKNNLFEVVNNIATNYILTQNFKDMQNLVSDLEYCDNLVILTSKIIQEKVHMKDITFMQQKLKAGVPIDKLANDKIAYFEKPLEKYDVKNTTNKRRMCIGIAKFYIQIANLFSAITMTLNPIFIYKDETGNEVEVPLSEKDKIPKGVDVKVINNNLCQKRIDILMNNNEKYNDKNSTINLNLDDEYIINPNFCNMNLSSSGNIKNMKKMAGIPELKSLYNDVYDYDTGSFKNMSPEMEQEYNKDLITFYKAFTGESKFPVDPDTQQSAIKSFRDIKLRNYALLSGCKNGNYKQEFTGNLRDSLFIKYANNIKNMIQSTETNQNSLIEILDQVFSVTKNKETGAEMFTINPSLNQTKLNALVKDAKNKIMNLYINCEKQFSEGINIYEAIVKQKILSTTQAQIDSLNKELEKNNLGQTEPQPQPEVQEAQPQPQPEVQEAQPQPEVQEAQPQPQPEVQEAQPQPEVPQPEVQESQPQPQPEVQESQPQPQPEVQEAQPQPEVQEAQPQPQPEVQEAQPQPEVLNQKFNQKFKKHNLNHKFKSYKKKEVKEEQKKIDKLKRKENLRKNNFLLILYNYDENKSCT